jgi:hypothetical protein
MKAKKPSLIVKKSNDSYQMSQRKE